MSVLGAHELAAARLEPLRESLLGSRRRCEAELRDAQEALDVLLDASEDEPRSPS